MIHLHDRCSICRAESEGKMSDTITTVEGQELLKFANNSWPFLNREEFERIMTIFYWAIDRAAAEMMEDEE